jgi:hypothetical protein
MTSKSVQTTIPLQLMYEYCKQYHKQIPPLAGPLRTLISQTVRDYRPLTSIYSPKHVETVSFSFRITFPQLYHLRQLNPGVSVSAIARSLIYNHTVRQYELTPLEIYEILGLAFPSEFPKVALKESLFQDQPLELDRPEDVLNSLSLKKFPRSLDNG